MVKLVPYGPLNPEEDVNAVVVEINVVVTSAVTAFEVAPLKFVSPAYTAVSVCVTVDIASARTRAAAAAPVGANAPENVATPDASSVPVPICVVPSRNDTEPVAVLVDVLVTATLSATVPAVADEDVFVSVAVGVTFVVSMALDVAVLKFVSPPYTAVRMPLPYVPLYVATPEAFSVPVPTATAPSRNCTVPVGIVVVPEGGVTVADRLDPAVTTANTTVGVTLVVAFAVAVAVL
jgi:hypothetical protein